MKRRYAGVLLLLLLVCAGVGGITAESAKRIRVTGISFTNVTNGKLTVEKGRTYILKIKITPTNATNKKLTYATSNKKIVSVSKSGKLKAIKKGKAKITATTTDGSKKSTSVTVTVGTRVKKVTVNNYKKTLMVGQSYSINPVVTPTSATLKTLTYSSSNPKVATVSNKGVVKALSSAGNDQTTITICSTDGSHIKVKVVITVVPTPAQSIPDDKEPEVTTPYIAHMGYSSKEPANSVPSYEAAAVSQGFIGIECDVRETKDGKFVLYHDENLSSRTNGSGLIQNLTLKQILEVNLVKGTNIASYENLKLPTLEQYLEICQKYEKIPYLHIKNVKVSSYGTIIEMLREYDLLDKAVITAGKAVLQQFRVISKEVNLSWLCYLSKSGIDWAYENNIQLNSDYRYITKEEITYAHGKGMTVGAWTVNSTAKAKELLEMGVDYITTDYILGK